MSQCPGKSARRNPTLEFALNSDPDGSHPSGISWKSKITLKIRFFKKNVVEILTENNS